MKRTKLSLVISKLLWSLAYPVVFRVFSKKLAHPGDLGLGLATLAGGLAGLGVLGLGARTRLSCKKGEKSRSQIARFHVVNCSVSLYK